jgi:hypothetical protein
MKKNRKKEELSALKKDQNKRQNKLALDISFC